MLGFVLDYRGTLDTLGDPVSFVRALKVRYPHAKVVIWTNAKESIATMHPCLLEAVDACIEKPFAVQDTLGRLGWSFESLIFVDDDPDMRRMLKRTFRHLTTEQCRILTPSDMGDLLSP